MANFLYLAAHKNLAMHGSASATVDADYLDDWLNDGRPGRPARGTSGTLSATSTNASTGNVNLVAIVNHNLNANVTLGGSLAGTITAPATQQNGIPLNVFVSITLTAGVGSFTIAASNSGTWVIGEVMAGEATSLTLPLYTSDEIEENDFARSIEMDLSSIPPYDAGLKARTWSCTWPALTVAERDGLIAARDAQRSNTRPTLVVRISDVNDAMCGFITALSYQPSQVPARYEVSMTFSEIPRVRW
jgi:hypothetical protein